MFIYLYNFYRLKKFKDNDENLILLMVVSYDYYSIESYYGYYYKFLEIDYFYFV